jgi:general glycosylation pathway protein
LFKCGDANELASKLENLMRDEALQKRLVQNANENLDEFSQDRIVELWQGLIDRFARK